MYLVGSFVLVSLVSCGRGAFQTAEREPWRAEAEVACLKSGAVKEGAELVRINPISGPGVCGAEFPLKVAALGEGNGSIGFADDMRPPGNVGGGNGQPRWPVAQPTYAAPSNYPETAVRQPGYGNGRSDGPVSLTAPGVAPQEDDIDLPAEGSPTDGPGYRSQTPNSQAYPENDRYSPLPSNGHRSAASPPQDFSAPPRLGPAQGNVTGSVGPVAIKPVATLACPIVSVLERWLADSVQPSAMRWFGARVVEIKQISAYSCRGMNGNSRAHISEHAFGNALDIAAFTLADGRRITVKDGWHGMPEEQGFLRDVQGAACQQFNTVLAPGSNVYHYDHIHVDLMRRASRRLICQPAAVSGEQIAARVQQRSPYANRENSVTGSIGSRIAKAFSRKPKPTDDEDYENE